MIGNKLMGLAALALLAGGIGFTAVGCSSTDEPNEEEETDGGTKTDSGVKPKPDAADGDTCTPGTADADFFTSYPGSSTGKQGSCSAAELTTIKANFAKTGITEYPELAAGVGETCKSCFMLGIDGTSIPETNVPLYVYVKAEPGRGFVNGGFCAANIAGSSVACGKAIAAANECPEAACTVDGANCGAIDDASGEPDDDLAACIEDVSADEEHSCATVGGPALETGCGAALQTVATDCFGQTNGAYTHWIEVACGGGGTGDGGTTTDAGDGG